MCAKINIILFNSFYFFSLYDGNRKKSEGLLYELNNQNNSLQLYAMAVRK